MGPWLIVLGTTSVMLGSHWVLSPVPTIQDGTPPYRISPLMSACRGGHVSVVELLLRAGADVDKADENVRGLEHTANLVWSISILFMCYTCY
jgi:ankyrin repeat protein